MTFVITQPCCNDAACVPACPVNCIHPTPDEPEFVTAEQLYIDPESCIECGACVDVCPVSAIHPDYELPASAEPFVDLNARWYAEPGRRDYLPMPPRPTQAKASTTLPDILRIAVVGSGPSACYFVEECLQTFGAAVEVNIFERLPVVGGLVRHGIAPDHQSTKAVGDRFASSLRAKNVRLFLNCEVGKTITHDDLLAHHNAVVYATGAPEGVRMGIEGEDLPGSLSAHDLVSWYNGHPDAAGLQIDLSHERALVVGNGNVALDVARILTASVDDLRSTDISDAALEQLAASDVREVVVAARRGADQAAFSAGELVGLAGRTSVGLVCEDDELAVGAAARAIVGPLQGAQAAKVRLLGKLRPNGRERVIRFRFGLTPTALRGGAAVDRAVLRRQDAVVEGGVVRWLPTGQIEELACGLVVSCIGYRRPPDAGLPFDARTGLVAHVGGRIEARADSSGAAARGRYVVGWAKRGPSGGVGLNRGCAQETLRTLVADLEVGLLNAPAHDADALHGALGDAPIVDRDGWLRLDASERAAGRAQARPRVKLVSVDQMLARLDESVR